MTSLVKNVVHWALSICGKKPKFVENGFKHPYCSRSCARNGKVKTGPRLRELRSDGATFKSVRAQFLSEWESKKVSATMEKAYEVVLPRDVRRVNTLKRLTVHLRLGFQDSTLCDFKSCGICCIIKSSFKTLAFGAPFNSGGTILYGDGIYSYRNPALADRFATSCTSSPYRVMIACDVIVEPGQATQAEENNESLFVPVADAILPVYVIMYTTQ
ncbi:hypothetical protein BDQ17DRAFT_1358447 [Cyathus striatus]|nr:hypothetical protein BDQ17DRAFT_1358447 [Cyathus striatus]